MVWLRLPGQSKGLIDSFFAYKFDLDSSVGIDRLPASSEHQLDLELSS